MRKGFHTLCGLAQAMGHTVTDGDAFVFVSRNRKQTRVLWYEGAGICLLAKKRVAGRFAALWERNDGGEVELTMSELSLLLWGAGTPSERVPEKE